MKILARMRWIFLLAVVGCQAPHSTMKEETSPQEVMDTAETDRPEYLDTAVEPVPGAESDEPDDTSGTPAKLPETGEEDGVWYYLDLDGDGFGDWETYAFGEMPPNGVTMGLDCDDGNSAVNPLALEICDGLDNDCDGLFGENEVLLSSGHWACETGLGCQSTGLTFEYNYDLAPSKEKWNCHGTNGVSCNAYNGDTPCVSKRPILCVQDGNLPAPPSVDFWTGNPAKISPGVEGCVLGSPADMTTVCQYNFGSSWRVATFHDDHQWRMTVQGPSGAAVGDRAWLTIYDQNAECWNP